MNPGIRPGRPRGALPARTRASVSLGRLWFPLVAAWLFGCAATPRVVTVVDPAGRFIGRRTFQILRVPECATRKWPLDPNDPMVLGSPLNGALRSAIVRGLEARGYAVVPSNGDLQIAYYASSWTELDVGDWDYGYPWKPVWWHTWRLPADTVESRFPAGTVIVDAVDSFSRSVLWRGRASYSPSVSSSLESTIQVLLRSFPPMHPEATPVTVETGTLEPRCPDPTPNG